ncbi:MAG: hypothetical protein ACHRXM_33740 [Isosphaerales bacterium]
MTVTPQLSRRGRLLRRLRWKAARAAPVACGVFGGTSGRQPGLTPYACAWYYNTTRHEKRSMPFDSIIWDLDDDPDGNVQHCAEHGVTREEVEEVFQNATDADISRSSGRPVVFGDTSTGRHLMVVYEEIDADTVYPVTAYDVPRRQRP